MVRGFASKLPLVGGLVAEERLGGPRVREKIRDVITATYQRLYRLRGLLSGGNWAAIGMLTAVATALLAILWTWRGEAAGLLAFALLFGLLLSLFLSHADDAYRQRRSGGMARTDFRQLEALLSLHSVVDCTEPLPPMRGWAVSPDFALILASLVRDRKPRTVVETGSGVSSLVVGYCLRDRSDKGICISLEHDPDYVGVSSRNVERHGLMPWVRICHAPLRQFDVSGDYWHWYDLDALERVGSIDLVIVDGPPGYVQKFARYPALPLLFQKLSEDAVIVVDDYRREEERSVVERWLREFLGFTLEEVDTEKGAAVLKRGG